MNVKLYNLIINFMSKSVDLSNKTWSVLPYKGKLQKFKVIRLSPKKESGSGHRMWVIKNLTTGSTKLMRSTNIKRSIKNSQ